MSSRTTRLVWGEPETDLLVEERRQRNEEYHFRYREDKKGFWESVSQRIRRRYHTRYSARQCESKFRNLLKEYRVNK